MGGADIYRIVEAAQVGRLEIADAVSAIMEIIDREPEPNRVDPYIIHADQYTGIEIVALVGEESMHGNVIIAGLDVDGAEAFTSDKSFEYYPIASLGRVMTRPPTARRGSALLVAGAKADAALMEAVEVCFDTFGISFSRESDVELGSTVARRRFIEKASDAGVVVWVAGGKTAGIQVVAPMLPTPVIAIPSPDDFIGGVDAVTALRILTAARIPGVVFTAPNDGLGAAVAAARILPVDADHAALREKLTGGAQA